MKKTIFEEMGGTYIGHGVILSPALLCRTKKNRDLLEYGDKDICGI